MGAGRGREVTLTVEGGAVGVIIDCRGRPMTLPSDTKARIEKLKEWHSALGLEAE